MNWFLRSSLISAAAISASLTAHAQTPPSAPLSAPAQPAAEIKLEELPAKLAEIEQELKQHLTTYLAVIDAEAKAKRLSEAYAQSLRWSGQTAVENSGMVEGRALVSTARMPSDNPAVVEARAVLDAALGALGTRRSALLSAVTRTVRREIAEAIWSHPTIAQLKTLAGRVESLREVARNRSNAYSNDAHTLLNANSAVAWLLQIAEAEASQDPDKLRAAAQQYASAGDLISEKDRTGRVAQLLEPLIARGQAAQKALQDTVEAAKPAKDRLAALINLEETVQALQTALGGQSISQAQAVISPMNAYRAMARALLAVEAGDAGAAMSAFQEARNASQQAGRAGAWINGHLIKWEAEVVETAAKNAEARRTKMRAQLAAVKTLADLELIADELASRQRVSRSRGGTEQEDYSQLAQQLAILATAWSAASPALLQQDRYGGAQPGMPFAKEVAAVRKIVEREVLARSLRAPELNQPPLADLPAEAALEKLGDELAKRAEWRRLYQLVQARVGFAGGDPRLGQHDLLGALQLFLAGQNFELAEQWADAVQAYKGVLRSTSERAPVAAAAERLKALTKDHPEANAPAANPMPVRPFQ